MVLNKNKIFKTTSKISNIINGQTNIANKILDVILQQMIFRSLNIRR